MNAARAFPVLLQECARSIRSNERGILEQDPGALHQYRVAVRRMRALLSVFDEVIHGRRQLSLKRDLQWVMSALAPARDMDVLRAEALQSEGYPKSPRKRRAALTSRIAAQRLRAYRRAARALQSPRYLGLLAAVAPESATGIWASDADAVRAGKRDAAKFLRREVRHRRTRLVRKGRRLPELSARQRHRLRIRAKQLRYAVEFLDAIPSRRAPPASHRELLHALRQIQAHLGALRDAEIQEALLVRLLRRADDRPVVRLGGAKARARTAERHLDATVRALRKVSKLRL